MDDILTQINTETQKLSKVVNKLDSSSAISVMTLLLKLCLHTKGYSLPLLSKVKQIGYLISLCLTSKGDRLVTDKDIKLIFESLQNIENLYRQIHYGTDDLEQYYGVEYRKELVALAAYEVCFFNGELVYFEQIIDKILFTFKNDEQRIIQQTGFSLNDYINFFLESHELSLKRIQDILQILKIQNFEGIADNVIHSYSDTNPSELLPVRLSKRLCISVNDYQVLEVEKAASLLNIFSTEKINESKKNYYGSKQAILSKPFIKVSNEKYLLYYDTQLLVAIYEYLLNLLDDKRNNKSSTLRKTFLENKTRKLFENFFSSNTKFFSNYYLEFSDKEKDLLIIGHNFALIIECKSDKVPEPFRNTDRAYTRLKRDFESSIQKGYEQALEVEEAFYNCKNDYLKICDKNHHIVEEISIGKINTIYSLIVTQERYGLVQIDLGLLLQKEKEVIYPWSVCIDDLETILLTLARKERPYKCFFKYLDEREKLNERVICQDELDIAANFIMIPNEFIKLCNSDEVITFKPDHCLFFDDLYHYGGIGFENEINLTNKFSINIHSYMVYCLCRKLKLNIPKRVKEFKKKCGINNRGMDFFDKQVFQNPTEINKLFIQQMENKSFSWDKLIPEYEKFINFANKKE